MLSYLNFRRYARIGNCMHVLLRAFLLVLLFSLRSFLLSHWFLLRAFSHTQLDHHIKIAEVQNEVFGSCTLLKQRLYASVKVNGRA